MAPPYGGYPLAAGQTTAVNISVSFAATDAALAIMEREPAQGLRDLAKASDQAAPLYNCGSPSPTRTTR